VTDDRDRRTVLVTGAGGHLGSAIARSLASRGAALVLLDRAAEGLERTRAGLPEGAAVSAVVAEVTDPMAPELALAAALDRFGRLDALVNNAGIEGPIGPAEDVSLDDLRRVLEVNVVAVLGFSAVAVRHFRGVEGGRIVNVASGAGLAGTAYMAAYSASKHAVLGLTRSMAQETAAVGIPINAVCPGCVDSPMMGRIEARLGALGGGEPASFVGSIPMRRYADPSEVGEAVAWLALEAPRYVTGSAMVIDGGLRA
jgi:NAD(P)-dependent dehydrogenase (short-subunit alcohol dehydrogenase family)